MAKFQAVPAGDGNERVTADIGAVAGKDERACGAGTTYMTVILGPQIGIDDNGLPFSV
jgi:hypothetical protein